MIASSINDDGCSTTAASLPWQLQDEFASWCVSAMLAMILQSIIQSAECGAGQRSRSKVCLQIERARDIFFLDLRRFPRHNQMPISIYSYYANAIAHTIQNKALF
jgi:hypothetical protein